MGPAGQQTQHPLRIVRVNRLAKHQPLDYDDGVGRKDGPAICLCGNRTSLLDSEATGVGPCVFTVTQAFVDVCWPDLEGNPRRCQEFCAPG